MPDSDRRLYVTWRRPSGLIEPVGLLTRRFASDGAASFRFVYLKVAEQMWQAEGFSLLPGFCDLHRVYESEELFATFAIRQMPRRRSDYGNFVQQLALGVETDPFEVMIRNEGRLVTDERIEVFAEPSRTDGGDLTTVFFARGVRHYDGASRAIEKIRAGDELRLRTQPDNPVDPRALLVNSHNENSAHNEDVVGWVPNYLLGTIDELHQLDHTDVRVTAEHVNPPTSAPQMRLLCRLTAPWPNGYEPFSGPEFQPIIS